jgi:hypothetical protein
MPPIHCPGPQERGESCSVSTIEGLQERFQPLLILWESALQYHNHARAGYAETPHLPMNVRPQGAVNFKIGLKLNCCIMGRDPAADVLKKAMAT